MQTTITTLYSSGRDEKYLLEKGSLVWLPEEKEEFLLIQPDEILWENETVLSKLNRNIDRLTQHILIPKTYLTPLKDNRDTRPYVEGCDSMSLYLNGGRSAELPISTTFDLNGLEYRAGMLNFKSAGSQVPDYVIKNPRGIRFGYIFFSGFYNLQNMEICGGMTQESALGETNEDEVFILNKIPYTPNVRATLCPKKIDKALRKMELNADTRKHLKDSELMLTENLRLAQLSRIFTTNIRDVGKHGFVVSDKFYRLLDEAWPRGQLVEKLIYSLGRLNAFANKIGNVLHHPVECTIDGHVTDLERIRFNEAKLNNACPPSVLWNPLFAEDFTLQSITYVDFSDKVFKGLLREYVKLFDINPEDAVKRLNQIARGAYEEKVVLPEGYEPMFK